MGLLQAIQVETGWPRSKGPIGSGLTTPTQTGLWAAVSLTFWLILSVSVRPHVAVATLPFMMLSGIGLAWSATRASVVGLAIEFVVANIVLALTSRGWLARAALRCLLGLMILGAATTFAGSYLQSKISRAIHAIQSDEAVAPERRIAMWTAAAEGWSRSPVAGVGIGGVPSIMERAPVASARDTLRQVRMIHSTYLQVLTETGIVGACLLLGFIVLLFRDVLRALKDQSLLIAGFGSLIVWFIAAAFDGYQQSGGLLTVGAILIPLALADLRPRAVTACSDVDASRGRSPEVKPTSG
jgi:O-antigen ligase